MMFMPAAKKNTTVIFTWLCITAFFLLSPVSLFAAEEHKQPASMISANPVGANQLASVTLGLVVVLGLIFALAWLFRRYGNLPTFNRSNIKMLGGISLGTREKAVLLEFEGVRLLVGVAAGQVSLLHKFPDNDSTTGTGEFAPSPQLADTHESFADSLKHEQAKTGRDAS